MPRLPCRRLLAVCLLASAVVAGCQVAPPRPVSRAVLPREVLVSAAPVEEAGGWWTGARLEPVGKSVSKAEVKVVGPKMPVQTVAHAVDQTAYPNPVAPKSPAASGPVQKAPLANVAMPKAPKLPTPPPLPAVAKADKTATPQTSPTEPCKSSADSTADSSFGHAADYSWISGEVQKWRQEWRLRYRPVDEVDPHGGSVTLAGVEHFEKLKDGEHFKLQGRLVANDGKAGGAVFYIDVVEAVP